ncbi:MAG: DinB family protein [Candidatus Hydrogenedentes bacterium]|nr:DinB family protein [Candidatus Hydrogenedentota bacterium]
MSSTPGGADLYANLERTIGIAKDKFVALAEAMPEELYAWRPMDGVRSVGDVFVHVAADNWYGPALMDIAAPPETGVTSEGATVSAYQERDLSKEQIVAELVASFDHFLTAMDTMRDRLGEETMLGSNMVTYGDLWVRLATHMHEHLGQSIAYARANEVAPPWSM